LIKGSLHYRERGGEQVYMDRHHIPTPASIIPSLTQIEKGGRGQIYTDEMTLYRLLVI
jgi:hypothetical protein